ncbi:MAG: helix-turn-helix domain-containing protein [Thermoleophilia bacterium]
MARDETRFDDVVRRRLRQARRARGMTLEEVAGRAGMSPSTLSRLESGARRLAIDHLPPLSEALGVPIAELAAPAATADPRVRPRTRIMGGIISQALTRDDSGAATRAFRLLVPADRREPDEPRVHEGHMWLYVLSGRCRVILGEQDLVLEPGEAAEFSTWTPHWFGAVDGPVELLSIFGPEGERVHLRAHGAPVD